MIDNTFYLDKSIEFIKRIGGVEELVYNSGGRGYSDNEDYTVESGASKVALVFTNSDYVVKIPFTGEYDDYDDYDCEDSCSRDYPCSQCSRCSRRSAEESYDEFTGGRRREMSRLTFRDSKGELWIKDAAHIDEQGQICMLTDRLAAYEGRPRGDGRRSNHARPNENHTRRHTGGRGSETRPARRPPEQEGGTEMNKLNTIQKRGNLNAVYQTGDPGPGGAYHDYIIRSGNTPGEGDAPELEIAIVRFQRGARKDPTARHGVLDSDLLEIVRDRLQHFQQGDYATRENACALTHIEEALMWMNRRVEDRIERSVLGTYEK